jgi:ketosteroid isomerase-like protein
MAVPPLVRREDTQIQVSGQRDPSPLSSVLPSMKSQTVSHDVEVPAMTAERMRKAIFDAYGAYETDDRDTIEALIAPGFSFTSPYDDGIDRKAYFERCWPNHETTAKIRIERVFIEGDSAFVTYLGTSTSGRSFRNTEYLTFRGGQIASVEVYFGAEYRDGRFLQADTRHPNRTDDASPAAKH